MKVVNGSKKVILLPFGQQMINILPENISQDLVANRELVRAIIVSALPNQIGIVTYSAAELALINEVSGAAPFIYDNLETAIEKLLPEGIKPVVEQRTVIGGEVVKVEAEIQNQENTSNGDLQKLIEENETLKEKVNVAEAAAASNKQRVEQLEKELSEAKVAATQPVEDVETKKKLQDAETVISKLQTNISDEQEKNAKLTKELEEAQKTASNYLKKISEIEASKGDENQKMMSQISEQGSVISKQNAEIESLKKQIDELSTAPGESFDSIKAELEKAKSECEKFKGLLSNTVKLNGLVWNAEQQGYIQPTE